MVSTSWFIPGQPPAAGNYRHLGKVHFATSARTIGGMARKVKPMAKWVRNGKARGKP